MDNYSSLFSHLLGLGTIAAQVVFVALAIVYYASSAKTSSIRAWCSRYGLELAFWTSVIAVCGSLFLSFGLGYPPCELCWFQRIAMFPIPVLLGLGLKWKDEMVGRYALPLVGIGLILAAYHYLVQLGITSLTPCSASSLAVSCATKQIWEFGYISIPMMSATAFLLIGIFLLFHRRKLSSFSTTN